MDICEVCILSTGTTREPQLCLSMRMACSVPTLICPAASPNMHMHACSDALVCPCRHARTWHTRPLPLTSLPRRTIHTHTRTAPSPPMCTCPARHCPLHGPPALPHEHIPTRPCTPRSSHMNTMGVRNALLFMSAYEHECSPPRLLHVHLALALTLPSPSHPALATATW